MPTYDSQISRNDSQALIPEDVSRDILQAIARQSFVLQMATRLPDMPTKTRRLPVLSVLPTAYFVSGDTGLKQTTEVNWTNRYITAEEIAVIVPVPNVILDDVDYDIWTEIRPHIETAFGRLIDQALLYGGLGGYSKPSNDWPDGIVTGAAAASATVSLATAGDMYDALLGENGTFGKVEESGYIVTGSIAAPTAKAKMRGTRDNDGQPVFGRSGNGAFELDGQPVVFPDNGAVDTAQSLITSGDFRQLVYAMRQDITYTVTTTGVITDAAGAIVYNLFQQDMTAMRVVMRMGWQLPNPPNWLKQNDADVSRYPFAVLKG
ncbi:MAG TPA: phage major capsid protein [Reyranella sp.]